MAAITAMQAPVRTYVAYDFELSLPLGLRLKTGTLEVVGTQPSGQAEAFLGTWEVSTPGWAVCTVDGLPVRSHQQFGAALARAQRAVGSGAQRKTVNLGFQSIAAPQQISSKAAAPGARNNSDESVVLGAPNVQSNIVIVDGFPHFESDWRGVPVTPNVIASAIHRTYHVRTNPGMVTFVDDIARTSCYVELTSVEDARRVLVQYEKGVSPTLHHRDEAIADWILSLSSAPEDLVVPQSRSNDDGEEPSDGAVLPDMSAVTTDLTGPVLILEGFPTSNNSGWNGVRVNEVVVASMLHRTFGVRTNPGMVVFLDGDKSAKTRSCRIELSSIMDAQQVLLLYSRGKRPTLHRAEGQRGDNPFQLIIRAANQEGGGPLAAQPSEAPMPDGLKHGVESRNPQEMEPESARGSADGDDFASSRNDNESLILTGLPGPHPAWRFINDKVLASLIHRTFGVRTNANAVLVAPDRRSCRLNLSASDAMHVMHCTSRGQKITLEHRDSRMVGLDLQIQVKNPSLENTLKNLSISNIGPNGSGGSIPEENGVINTASQIMGQWKDQAAREESLPFGDLSQSSLPFSAYDPQKQAEAAAHSLQPQSLPSMYGFDVTPSLDVGAVTSNTGQGLGPLSPGLPSLTDGYSYFN